MRVALIAGFGAAGALARYGIGSAFGERDVPVATFLINVVGSFLLGVIVTWGAAKLSRDLAVGIGVGFLGAFTTFSTFAVDTKLLYEDGRWSTAATYVLLSVALGIAAAAAGMAVGRTVAR